MSWPKGGWEGGAPLPSRTPAGGGCVGVCVGRRLLTGEATASSQSPCTLQAGYGTRQESGGTVPGGSVLGVFTDRPPEGLIVPGHP